MQIGVNDVRQHFINELESEAFTIDKTGQKTIEMLGASFVANESSIFGTPNQEYIDREIDWYLSGSTNINDIYDDDRDPPAAWQYSANRHGEINSNYGHLIFDYKYYNQYDSVLDELSFNKDSRRASMIYQRPSIWSEYRENDKNDFICTNAVTYYIRNDTLHSVVQMRSNDVVYGYKNDYAWQTYVLAQLSKDLKVPVGDIVWQVQNLHVYERHFDLVK
jgi:thymidylate synthase|tara:strand:+ start:5197 stop:5856 length:660 start_codon:yes stop_codon:yes gene_type:complete